MAHHRFFLRCQRFFEKHGFYMVLSLCVVIVAATAVWTHRQTSSQPLTPEAPVQARQDQSLFQALQVTPRPSPTPQPITFSPPVTGKATRGFSGAQPVYFQHTGHWQQHLACDYEAHVGTPIAAIADGEVIACQDGSVVLRHREGYVSRYLGMQSAVYVMAGDVIQAGQVLGHIGSGPLWEQDSAPHLHLEVTCHGAPVDPETLW